MMCYYLNIQFQGQRVNSCLSYTYCFHSNVLDVKIGDVPPACDNRGALDKKISTYIYSSRRIAMYLSLMWLRTQKIVRPSGSNAGSFMCHQHMSLTNISLLNKIIYLNIM